MIANASLQGPYSAQHEINGDHKLKYIFNNQLRRPCGVHDGKGRQIKLIILSSHSVTVKKYFCDVDLSCFTHSHHSSQKDNEMYDIQHKTLPDVCGMKWTWHPSGIIRSCACCVSPIFIHKA